MRARSRATDAIRNLLFERSDGSRTVVRGGPDARAEGNDLANFAGSTVLGSKNFGHIVVDAVAQAGNLNSCPSPR